MNLHVDIDIFSYLALSHSLLDEDVAEMTSTLLTTSYEDVTLKAAQSGGKRLAGEFKLAMRVLHVNLPLLKMRRLFSLFDADESGSIDHEEFKEVNADGAAPSEEVRVRPLPGRGSGFV